MAILFDFEAPGLADQWQMTRGGVAAREACESSWCLHVKPAAGSTIGSRDVPADWTGFGELSYRARVATDTILDLRVAAGNGPGVFWRRIDLEAGDWREVHVPLGWLRRGDGAAPSWGTVKAVSVGFRDATEVWIDDMAVSAGTPVLSAEGIARVTGGGVTRGKHAAVVSLVPSLDAGALVARLDAVAAAMLADLPFLRPPASPATLVVYPDRGAWRDGVVKIGRAFAANVAAPAQDGFTLEGIATSSWDPAQGWDRPVYAHEYVHAFLSGASSLPNRGEWLQESLANWYQVRFHPQSTLADVVRGRLARPLPLARLCDGDRIESMYYADAWTVVGTLLEEPAWSGALGRVFEAAARSGTTSLVALGLDLEALDRDRRLWAARRFGW